MTSGSIFYGIFDTYFSTDISLVLVSDLASSNTWAIHNYYMNYDFKGIQY
jgi:hypothetical protein